MPTATKARTIEQAKEWYSKSTGVVFTDYRGMKVKELQELRANLRTKGAELHVLKNTLFRIAAGDDTANLTAELHNGTTAFAFVFENEASVAKALLDYAKTSKKLVVKGGYFSGKSFTPKEVEALSELPPRDVLISQVIGLIASPISNLVGVVEALYADPIRTIGAVADKVAEGSPLPTPTVDEPEATPESNSPEAEASPETTETSETPEASETTENA
ncbi:MAG: 50S ribosomal protein L10 [Fimbriimonas sp.]|nr:50S ribosomal protein L10 [Fimbriimonas sp.]